MSGKRILQIVKTFDGALWAYQQARELIKLGWEVHVMAPSIQGRYYDDWKSSGIKIHLTPCEFPVKTPWLLAKTASSFKEKILSINPDLIHSHFVSTTLLTRYALKEISIPRIFQVPGPLHLEHHFFGSWDKAWSTPDDWWIASSRFIHDLYRNKYGVQADRLFLSYYGTDLPSETTRSSCFREKYGIPRDAQLIGNVSFIYAPKYYLGQSSGLKGHELMIEGLSEVIKERDDVYVIFIGPQWGKSQTYFDKIVEKAKSISSKFIFTGQMPQSEIMKVWSSFDLAVHMPLSENCGGVVEPLLSGVPAMVPPIGGLPEVVLHHKTGYLLKERSAKAMADGIKEYLENAQAAKGFGQRGQDLVREMFDVKRTAFEIDQIYRYILGHSSLPPRLFDSTIFR